MFRRRDLKAKQGCLVLLAGLHLVLCSSGHKRALQASRSAGRLKLPTGVTTEPWAQASIPKLIHIKPVPNKHSYDSFRGELISKWRQLNPSYEVKLWDDDDCKQMIEKNFPWYITLYESVDTAVERADIWKYMVMYLYGGVYADDDVEPRVPIDQWHLPFLTTRAAGPIRLMLGLEYVTAKPQEWPIFVNAVMYSQPRNPLFMNVIDIVEQRCLKERQLETRAGDAVQRTGPLPFSEGVWEYMEMQGLKQDLLRLEPLRTHHHKDFVLLGTRKFRPASAADPEAYVVHWLRGSWKNKTAEHPV